MLPPNNLDNSFIKPLTPGEVARSIVTERDVGTGVLWLCGVTSFFMRRKKKQKSRRRLLPRLCPKPRNALLVWEKINACFLTVGTFVLGCPIVVLRKSKRDSINRIISLCYELLTSFVGRVARRAPRIVRWTIRSQSGEQFIIATGNCSRRHSIRTVGDACPYNFETSVLAQTNDL